MPAFKIKNEITKLVYDITYITMQNCISYFIRRMNEGDFQYGHLGLGTHIAKCRNQNFYIERSDTNGKKIIIFNREELKDFVKGLKDIGMELPKI